MSFNADDKRVYDLLNDKEYIIPINQRKYIWKITIGLNYLMILCWFLMKKSMIILLEVSC